MGALEVKKVSHKIIHAPCTSNLAAPILHVTLEHADLDIPVNKLSSVHILY